MSFYSIRFWHVISMSGFPLCPTCLNSFIWTFLSNKIGCVYGCGCECGCGCMVYFNFFFVFSGMHLRVLTKSKFIAMYYVRLFPVPWDTFLFIRNSLWDWLWYVFYETNISNIEMPNGNFVSRSNSNNLETLFFFSLHKQIFSQQCTNGE